MEIIKKDGKLEKFNSKKIKTSIENSANEAGIILNESDLIMLVQDIESKLLKIREKQLITSSYEVIGVVLSVLKKTGFKQVIKSYIKF
ncbi:ATP cone domain-containing protein [Clostridium gasigenes]|uniref:ATP cone domain-containing protein n=1 Tax=Clostridium gasigenes TaxID=94869 RepID=A0A1H0RYT4_9CLOT|nr:ATP cone domain-containing protein [Clostridium gasigenes]SDP34555.1 ATP cone domain-containing protein [Clostridium gasigenes]